MSQEQTTQLQQHQRQHRRRKTLKNFIHQFIHESLEISIFLYVISTVTEKELRWSKLVRISFIVGLLQTLIEWFDHTRHVKIKDGMLFSVGSSVFA